MRIDMTLGEAQARRVGAWQGTSLPLPAARTGDRPDDLAWWTAARVKNEVIGPRHRLALYFYLRAGARAVGGLPPHCFPALFEFLDGKAHRPDKGVIRELLAARPPLLVTRHMGDTLLFEATEAGRQAMAGT